MRRPPGIEEPFASPEERALYMRSLLELDERLDAIKKAASLTGAELRSSPAWRDLANARTDGVPIEMRLRQWTTAFEADLVAIRNARNHVVHSTWISDPDLRAAVWLGGELMRLITGNKSGRLTAS